MTINHGTINTNMHLRIVLTVTSFCLLAYFGMSLSAEPAAMSEMKAEIRLVMLSQPVEFRTPEGDQGRTREMVKIRLVSPSPIPARALDPVIAVGEHLVTEYRYTGANELEFTDYQPEKLKDGSEMYFQWGRTAIPQQRQKLPLAFDREAVEVITQDTAGQAPIEGVTH